MKRLLIILLAIVMTFCLIACDNSSEPDAKESNSLTIPDSADEFNHIGTIPDGGTYITGLVNGFMEDENGKIVPESIDNDLNSVYVAGDKFPDIDKNYQYYVFGDYVYELEPSGEGEHYWLAYTVNRDKDSYDDMLTSVNKAFVTDVSHAFAGCKNLKITPTLPNSITNMYEAFSGCENLEIVTNIPANVQRMYGTFWCCPNLTTVPAIPSGVNNLERAFYENYKLTAIEINANVVDCYECFKGISKDNLTITGNCSQETKDNLLNTAD